MPRSYDEVEMDMRQAHGFQFIRRTAPIALGLLMFLPGIAAAETIVLKDGSTVTGELIGFDNGEDRVRIGKFTKTIPEANVQDVRDGGGNSTAGDTAPPPAATAPRSARPVSGQPGTSGHTAPDGQPGGQK